MYQNAGEGLRKMYVAELGVIICTFLTIIPVINIFAAIVSVAFLIISVLGLNAAGKDISGCQKAFTLTIVQIVVSVVGAFFKGAFMSAVFAIAGKVLAFLIIFNVCTSVSEVMNSVGASEVAQSGNTVIKISVICCGISVVLEILGIIPLIKILAAVASVFVAIVQIVSEFIYLGFLKRSSERLS